MRLCLLLQSVHTQACNEEVNRLLSLKMWEQAKSDLWENVRPGLIIFCLKCPAIKDVYMEMIPKEVIEKMKSESKPFYDLFSQ